MTIRARLSLNVVLVMAVIGVLAATSLVGIGFIRAKLSLLTTRSTPFQTRTLEFQRDIQAVTAELIKLGETTRQEELAANDKDAQAALAQVAESQAALETLTAQRMTTADELDRLRRSLSSVVATRVRAAEEANRAAEAMSAGLRDASSKLKALDGRVRDLQLRQSRLYVGSVEEGQRLSEDLRSIEVLRTTLKDVQAAAAQLGARPPAAWPKHFASLSRRATQNGYVRRQERLRAGVQALIGQIEEVSKRAGSDSEPPDLDGVEGRYDEVMALLEDDSDAANEKFSDIYGKQKGYAAQAGLGVAALSANANLVSLGASLDGLARVCFTAASPADLERVTREIEAAFGKIGAAQRDLAKTLQGLGATPEAGLLRGAAQSLEGVRSLLLGEGGLVARLRHRMEMEEKSRGAMAELRRMVLSQVARGKQTVSEARGEQDASIAAVNRVARLSASLIAAMAGVSVLAGAAFGLWIYRSVARPVQRLIASADRVASGDLSEEIHTLGKDELARVAAAMGKMVASLRDIIARIRGAVASLASSSEELSVTARNLESGSQQQDARIQQSAAAIVQMSKTVQEVAGNTSATAEAAARVRESTESGRASMHGTAHQLARFAEEVRQAADTVESLGERSKEIDSIVALIKDVADQTNLLALNAAIEAARAGEQGRGFAVVAENVRQLAEKTSSAAGDISATVRSMQTGVTRSVEVMASQRRTVEAILADVQRTLASIDRTAEDVAEVSQMVQQITVAAQQQALATDDISGNMEDIAGVTRQLRQSFEEVTASSEGLSQLATDLENTVAWFRQ